MLSLRSGAAGFTCARVRVTFGRPVQCPVTPPRRRRRCQAHRVARKKSGAPGVIRTHDLCLRRATLYPAELRAPGAIQYPIGGPGATGAAKELSPQPSHLVTAVPGLDPGIVTAIHVLLPVFWRRKTWMAGTSGHEAHGILGTQAKGAGCVYAWRRKDRGERQEAWRASKETVSCTSSRARPAVADFEPPKALNPTSRPEREARRTWTTSKIFTPRSSTKVQYIRAQKCNK
jgi:hypothetical protein